MSYRLLLKIACIFSSLCISLSSFAQEPLSNSADIKVQKEKLETDQLQMAAINAEMLKQQAKLSADLAMANMNVNNNKIVFNTFKKVDPKDLKSKEISMELPVSKTAEIYIENTSSNIDIKVWDQPKVKIVTTVLYEGDTSKISDAEWFEKINLSFKSTPNSIKIKSNTNGTNFYRVDGSTISWSGVTPVPLSMGIDVATAQKKWKKSITIYVPKDNNLDIDSKFSEINIEGNLNKLNLDITNGGIDMDDVTKLFLKSKYANINVGNIKIGEIDLMNGRFIAKDAEDLDLDTKYATIEAGAVKKLMIRSTNDEYEIEEVGSITCRKNYGNLRITKLNISMELDGTNADLKIRNISENVESIKVNNKYADIRLPMRNVKNYMVTYQGAYSTVYASFEKKPFVVKEDTKSTGIETTQNNKLKPATRTNTNSYNSVLDIENNTDSHFTAAVGDGKGARLDLKCQNCTVDFK